MADRTKIEVTEATWNPITGCSPCSAGCRRCYARRFAHRLRGRYGYPADAPFALTVHKNRMDQPLRWKKPRHIFAGSMGDLFHEDAPAAALQQVFEVMARTPHHVYMVITKRPEQLARWVARQPQEFLKRLHPHIWMGVSAENQACAEERLPLLLDSWKGHVFACCEPLLDALDLRPWLPRLEWVICGGETGPGGRVAPAEAVRDLKEQCETYATPFFLKHWGGPNKQRTGRLLDGRLWEQTPSWR